MEMKQESKPIPPLELQMQSVCFALFEAAAEGLVVIDNQGLIVFVNQCMIELLGYESHELIGARIEKFVPKRYEVAHHGRLPAGGDCVGEYFDRAGQRIYRGAEEGRRGDS